MKHATHGGGDEQCDAVCLANRPRGARRSNKDYQHVLPSDIIRRGAYGPLEYSEPHWGYQEIEAEMIVWRRGKGWHYT